MLQRHSDWFSLLKVGAARRRQAEAMLDRAYALSQGMMHRRDLEALAAALLHVRPVRIFEIGTFRGASANFMLDLLPAAEVISIAFVNAAVDGQTFNNDNLAAAEVGGLVSDANRGRFTQLFGDSHQIDAQDFLRAHGRMDLVFIDGDHSRDGVRQDTELARQILAPRGAIAWHDANPKKRYVDTRLFLEQDLTELALATSDDFVGGVALWTKALERRLNAPAL